MTPPLCIASVVTRVLSSGNRATFPRRISTGAPPHSTLSTRLRSPPTDRDETIARALERGAVDYQVKPLSATELTARIQVALRKRAGPEAFALGDLAVDCEARRVTTGGLPVRLTATGYEFLRLFTQNAVRVSTYESLIRRLWSEPDGRDADRVRTFVKQLQRKLCDDPARPAWILNKRGVG